MHRCVCVNTLERIPRRYIYECEFQKIVECWKATFRLEVYCDCANTVNHQEIVKLPLFDLNFSLNVQQRFLASRIEFDFHNLIFTRKIFLFKNYFWFFNHTFSNYKMKNGTRIEIEKFWATIFYKDSLKLVQGYW